MSDQPEQPTDGARSLRGPCLITLGVVAVLFASAFTLFLWQPWRTAVAPWQLALRVDVTTCDRKTGVASAFAIGPRILVTNQHVVENAARLRVRTWDGRSLRVRQTRAATSADLGVIELAAPAQHVLPLRNEDPLRGETVIAVGYPRGGLAVAGRGRVVDYADGSDVGEPTRIIRATTTTAPGSSGGPLLDARHRVVGLIFAIDRESGLTLAIPTSKLRPLLDDVNALAEVEDC